MGSAERAALLHTLRKRKSQTIIGRRCPFKSCKGKQLYRKLGQHLKQVHKWKPSDVLYEEKLQMQDHSTANFEEEHHWARVKEEYKEFLESFEGSLLSSQIAGQQARKVTHNLKCAEIKNQVDVVNPENTVKLQNYFHKYASSRNPSSAKAYMSCLARYLEHIHVKHGVKKEDCDSLRGKNK